MKSGIILTTDRQTELENCNFIKTVLMMLVVFYHSIVFWGGNWFTQNPEVISVPLNIVADWLNSFHIYDHHNSMRFHIMKILISLIILLGKFCMCLWQAISSEYIRAIQ